MWGVNINNCICIVELVAYIYLELFYFRTYFYADFVKMNVERKKKNTKNSIAFLNINVRQKPRELCVFLEQLYCNKIQFKVLNTCTMSGNASKINQNYCKY